RASSAGPPRSGRVEITPPTLVFSVGRAFSRVDPQPVPDEVTGADQQADHRQECPEPFREEQGLRVAKPYRDAAIAGDPCRRAGIARDDRFVQAIASAPTSCPDSEDGSSDQNDDKHYKQADVDRTR